MAYNYNRCPTGGTRDSSKTVYECSNCGHQGCWDKYGNGCWPKYNPCPRCKASGKYRKVGYITG